MKPSISPNKSWSRLARLAAQAPAQHEELPFGFATRVAAAWKASPAEGFFAVIERLTWPGVAVAAGILGICAATGYNTIEGLFTGETQFFGSWLGDILGL